MKQQKYYWKVVRNVRCELFSAIISRGKYCVKYKIGERIKAPFNGILVFETREHARLFTKNNYSSVGSFKIFKVMVYGNEIINQPFYDIDFLKFDNKIEIDITSHYPLGTHSFPEIELVSPQ